MSLGGRRLCGRDSGRWPSLGRESIGVGGGTNGRARPGRVCLLCPLCYPPPGWVAAPMGLSPAAAGRQRRGTTINPCTGGSLREGRQADPVASRRGCRSRFLDTLSGNGRAPSSVPSSGGSVHSTGRSSGGARAPLGAGPGFAEAGFVGFVLRTGGRRPWRWPVASFWFGERLLRGAERDTERTPNPYSPLVGCQSPLYPLRDEDPRKAHGGGAGRGPAMTNDLRSYSRPLLCSPVRPCRGCVRRSRCDPARRGASTGCELALAAVRGPPRPCGRRRRPSRLLLLICCAWGGGGRMCRWVPGAQTLGPERW